MNQSHRNTTLMIVILLFALWAVFFLDSLTESTSLFALMHKGETEAQTLLQIK